MFIIVAIDIQATDVSYNNVSIPIFRSITKTYSFYLTIKSSNESSDILSAHDGNWRVSFMLDNQSYVNTNTLQLLYYNGLLPFANMSANAFVQGLTSGSVAQLPITISLNFNYSVCLGRLYLCLLITPPALSAWYDGDISNNVACLLLDPYKDCSPG